MVNYVLHNVKNPVQLFQEERHHSVGVNLLVRELRLSPFQPLSVPFPRQGSPTNYRSAKALAFIARMIYSNFHIKETTMDLWILLGVVAVWFIINRWVLPKMGVPT
jgi:hypothetical protein